MKKMIVSGLLVAVLTVGSFAIAEGQEVTRTEAPPTNTKYVLTNTITGIDVPMEVLDYVQYQYIGHAVTKAEKIVRNGQDLYRLRVDRDDLANDYKSIILLYDMKWKLVGEEKLTPPPAPVVVPENNEENDEKEPENIKPQSEENDEKPRGSGGSGGSPPAEDVPVQEESIDETDTSSEG